MVRLTLALCSIFLLRSGGVRASANGDLVSVTFERCAGMICMR